MGDGWQVVFGGHSEGTGWAHASAHLYRKDVLLSGPIRQTVDVVTTAMLPFSEALQSEMRSVAAQLAATPTTNEFDAGSSNFVLGLRPTLKPGDGVRIVNADAPPYLQTRASGNAENEDKDKTEFAQVVKFEKNTSTLVYRPLTVGENKKLTPGSEKQASLSGDGARTVLKTIRKTKANEGKWPSAGAFRDRKYVSGVFDMQVPIVWDLFTLQPSYRAKSGAKFLDNVAGIVCDYDDAAVGTISGKEAEPKLTACEYRAPKNILDGEAFFMRSQAGCVSMR